MKQGIEGGQPMGGGDFGMVPQVIMGGMRNPESLPSFPALANQVDSFMSRVPWWLLVIGTVFAYRWLLPKIRG